jgi:hypothetical protein
MSAACVDQAMEHQKAIVLLIRRRHYGSALALVRLVFEAYVRGTWLHHCATDTEVTQYSKNRLQKEFRTLVSELEALESFKSGVLSAVKKRSWSAMNSFTHSGFAQAVRRNTENSIEPNYADGELLDALNFANAISLLSAVQIATLAADDALANEFLKKAKRLRSVAP